MTPHLDVPAISTGLDRRLPYIRIEGSDADLEAEGMADLMPRDGTVAPEGEATRV